MVPTPRMRIVVSDAALPVEFTNKLGVISGKSATSLMLEASSWSPENALIAIGTSWIACARRCAVTITSSRSPSSSCAYAAPTPSPPEATPSMRVSTVRAAVCASPGFRPAVFVILSSRDGFKAALSGI